jgi:hypothetical protein
VKQQQVAGKQQMRATGRPGGKRALDFGVHFLTVVRFLTVARIVFLNFACLYVFFHRHEKCSG